MNFALIGFLGPSQQPMKIACDYERAFISAEIRMRYGAWVPSLVPLPVKPAYTYRKP